MMVGYIETYDGQSYQLPKPVSWRVSQGTGEPCGDYDFSFIYNEKLFKALEKAVRFTAYYDGNRVFTGVVDEFSIDYDMGGMCCTMSGRSMAALLLDNQVPAQGFDTARLEDIISLYVRPMGIETVIKTGVMPIPLYAVGAGASRYDALADFLMYSAGLKPYFDRFGRLIIGRPDGSKLIRLGDTVSLKYKNKRYGVLSSVNYAGTIFGGSFAHEGGLCSKYIAELGDKTYKDGARLALLALSDSAEDRRVITASVPKAFAAGPYDIVRLSGFDPAGITQYEVTAAESSMSEAGQSCILTLK